MSHLESLRDRVIAQNQRNELFRQDTPDSVARMIAEEAQELAEEVAEAFITDNAWKVAGEIGDLIYLLIKLEQMLGIDLLEACEFKYERNEAKYGKAKDRATAKSDWKKSGGDVAWINKHYYTR